MCVWRCVYTCMSVCACVCACRAGWLSRGQLSTPEQSTAASDQLSPSQLAACCLFHLFSLFLSFFSPAFSHSFIILSFPHLRSSSLTHCCLSFFPPHCSADSSLVSLNLLSLSSLRLRLAWTHPPLIVVITSFLSLVSSLPLPSPPFSTPQSLAVPPIPHLGNVTVNVCLF